MSICVDSIYFMGHGKKDKYITVSVCLPNIGTTRLEVPLPEKMYDVIMAIAQNAADMHELQAKALLLAEQETKPAAKNGESE